MPKTTTCPDCLEAIVPTAEGACPFCARPSVESTLLSTAFLRSPLRSARLRTWILVLAILALVVVLLFAWP